MAAVKGRVVVYPGDKGDRRKKLYPLRQTAKLLRREHARVEARRQRSSDDAAGYWLALSSLKVMTGRLLHLSRGLAAAEREVRKVFRTLRDRPPRFEVEITGLPDLSLSLAQPLIVTVAPLRRIYWRASVLELGLRGEGRSEEEAVHHLREMLVSTFRGLQKDPDQNRPLWNLLSACIQVREASRPKGDPR